MSALFSKDRHEPLTALAWDEERARDAILRIAADTEARFSPQTAWPTHPNDAELGPAPHHNLYIGAGGVFWALRYLEARGAAPVRRDYSSYVEPLLASNRALMQQADNPAFGSYLVGDTGIRLLEHWLRPSAAVEAELARLIEATIDHPARELMWGSPGALLAASFLHGRARDARWAELYRATARRLWSHLQHSSEYGCSYWTQDLYGRRFTFLDAVHGFVATAAALIHGRALLAADEWQEWQRTIATTVRQTAEWDGDKVNWPAQLGDVASKERLRLMQFCHGSPGFVICLADSPDRSLDDLLRAGGEATWAAAPLKKGSNLCHGTGGNGYAFLKLFRRFGDAAWLERARRFAMHGILQTEADLVKHGRLRYSLWTGDVGFAIYLWDCVEGTDRFPTLDVFFAG